MLSILRSECSKPGLRNWVGNNTDIRVLKLNVLCQIQSWTLLFFKLHFGFFGPSCALGSLLQAVHVIFGLNSLKTRYIAHGEMK